MLVDKSLEEMKREIRPVFETRERVRSTRDGYYIRHEERYQAFYQRLLGDGDLHMDVTIFHLEMVCNAIEWGNSNDPRKYITIAQYVGELGIVISVEDQGNGFDYESHFKLLRRGRNFTRRGREGKRWTGGRGLKWFHRGKDIEVNFNQRGNQIFGKYRYPREYEIDPSVAKALTSS